MVELGGGLLTKSPVAGIPGAEPHRFEQPPYLGVSRAQTPDKAEKHPCYLVLMPNLVVM